MPQFDNLESNIRIAAALVFPAVEFDTPKTGESEESSDEV
jgi:hypothetical protein